MKKLKIIEENYKIATEKLDCYKNYINIPEDVTVNVDWIDLMEILKKCSDLIEEQSKDIKAKYEWIQKIEKEKENLWKEKGKLQEQQQKLNENAKKIESELQEKNKALQKELEEVYNSKRWKYTEKLSNIFHKK